MIARPARFNNKGAVQALSGVSVQVPEVADNHRTELVLSIETVSHGFAFARTLPVVLADGDAKRRGRIYLGCIDMERRWLICVVRESDGHAVALVRADHKGFRLLAS